MLDELRDVAVGLDRSANRMHLVARNALNELGEVAARNVGIGLEIAASRVRSRADQIKGER